MKRAERFVFDTNVLVSAMLFLRSNPALALQKAANEGKVVFSKECLDELSRVLMNDRFEKYLPFTKRQIFLLDLENASEFIEVNDHLSICRDPDDDKFLSLAKDASVSCIVSGDSDLLILHPFGSIAILSPSDFLKTG